MQITKRKNYCKKKFFHYQCVYEKKSELNCELYTNYNENS